MLIKIGDFAKMGQVSVRMLHHYDKLGLLNPAFVDPQSGFRYYSQDQLVDLHRMRDLQALGFSLKDIEAIRYEGDIESLHARLWQRQQDLKRELEERERQLKELQYRLTTIEQHNQPVSFPFVVKKIPAQTVIHARSQLRDETDIVDGFHDIMTYMRSHHISVKTAFGIKHYTIDDTEDFEWAFQLADMNFQHIQTDDGWELHKRQLPAVYVASAIIQGSYQQSLPDVNGFNAWASHHQFALCGAVRENYIRMMDNDIHHPDNLMEVQFPIRRTDFRGD